MISLLVMLLCCIVVNVDGLEAAEQKELPQFVNVAEEAGITFRHENGASGRWYMPEWATGGLAAFDYDGDGWTDLYVVNGGPLPGYEGEDSVPTNALYRNQGDGTFRDVTVDAGVGDTGYGMGCVAGDIDNDGDLDLYVSNYGPNVLYRNEGDGTFVDATAQAAVGDPGWGGGCAFADYDADGDLDLYVANYVEYALEDRATGLMPYLSGPLRQRAFEELELYAHPVNYPAASDRLYRNEGGGRFTEVSERVGMGAPADRAMGLLFWDYDDDGDPDLFAADDQGGNSLLRNDGPWPGGRFAEVGLLSGVGYDRKGDAQATMGACAGDFDNNGRQDLVTTAFRGEASAIYRNEGGGLFTDIALLSRTGHVTRPLLGWGVFLFDYDNDGWLDLFMATGHVQDGVEQVDPGTTTAQQNLLFHSEGAGRFADVSSTSGPGLLLRRQSRGAVCFDYDNDGDLDIAVLNKHCRIPDGIEDGVDLLRNDGGNHNHWLQVELVGRAPRGTQRGTSNRYGVGAKVTIWSGGNQQVREVRCGSGYQSHDDLRLHFGLGEGAHIDSLEVRWPGGARQMMRDLVGDRVLRIDELSGVTAR